MNEDQQKELEEPREKAIQGIADLLRILPFSIEFKVKKKPQGIKIIHEVTQDQMNEMMGKVKEGGQQ